MKTLKEQLKIVDEAKTDIAIAQNNFRKANGLLKELLREKKAKDNKAQKAMEIIGSSGYEDLHFKFMSIVDSLRTEIATVEISFGFVVFHHEFTPKRTALIIKAIGAPIIEEMYKAAKGTLAERRAINISKRFYQKLGAKKVRDIFKEDIDE